MRAALVSGSASEPMSWPATGWSSSLISIDLESPRPASGTPGAGDVSQVPKIKLDEFEKMRQQKDVTILDVRTPKEFADGHVPGAVNIDWRSRDFAEKVANLDKSKKYVLHCQAGI